MLYKNLEFKKHIFIYRNEKNKTTSKGTERKFIIRTYHIIIIVYK